MRTLEEQIVWLQERVAHAELARDNALAMRDEAKAMAKEKGQRAGEEIARLKQENDALRCRVSSYAHGARTEVVAEKARGMRDVISARLQNLDVVLAHAAKRENA